MKRCIKWLSGCFTDWISQFDWELIGGYVISGLLGIALTIITFVYADKVPATPSDYEQLEEQVKVIQHNPDLLLETDCNININGNIITVEFENDECKIIAKYDKNFEVLSTSKEDKSKFWLFALAIALIHGIFVTYCLGGPLSYVIHLLNIAAEWIFERVKKFKS